MCIEALSDKELNKLSNEIKQVSYGCPFDASIEVRDLSLKAKGPDEDRAFALNPDLWLNIRRGNTVADFYDGKKYDYSMVLRKGLNKFFDLSMDYVDSKTRYKDSHEKGEHVSGRGRFNPHNSLILKNQILYGAKKFLEEGKIIEIIKMVKANGENAQISWSEEAMCWVIASKNVCILAETRENVDEYKDQGRFFFAKQIAYQWFEIIKKIKDVKKLKYELNGKTLVGEYVGNPKF